MFTDVQIPLLIGAVAVAMVSFSMDRISAELTALGLLLFLVLAGLLPAEEAFAGFGSDVVLMMFGLLILMAALERTGVTDFAGRVILRQRGSSPRQILMLVMVAAVAVGGFVSNRRPPRFSSRSSSVWRGGRA
jgi:di/tricarboxylate transporter